MGGVGLLLSDRQGVVLREWERGGGEKEGGRKGKVGYSMAVLSFVVCSDLKKNIEFYI